MSPRVIKDRCQKKTRNLTLKQFSPSQAGLKRVFGKHHDIKSTTVCSQNVTRSGFSRLLRGDENRLLKVQEHKNSLMMIIISF